MDLATFRSRLKAIKKTQRSDSGGKPDGGKPDIASVNALLRDCQQDPTFNIPLDDLIYLLQHGNVPSTVTSYAGYLAGQISRCVLSTNDQSHLVKLLNATIPWIKHGDRFGGIIESIKDRLAPKVFIEWCMGKIKSTGNQQKRRNWLETILEHYQSKEHIIALEDLVSILKYYTSTKYDSYFAEQIRSSARTTMNPIALIKLLEVFPTRVTSLRQVAAEIEGQLIEQIRTIYSDTQVGLKSLIELLENIPNKRVFNGIRSHAIEQIATRITHADGNNVSVDDLTHLLEIIPDMPQYREARSHIGKQISTLQDAQLDRVMVGFSNLQAQLSSLMSPFIPPTISQQQPPTASTAPSQARGNADSRKGVVASTSRLGQSAAEFSRTARGKKPSATSSSSSSPGKPSAGSTTKDHPDSRAPGPAVSTESSQAQTAEQTNGRLGEIFNEVAGQNPKYQFYKKKIQQNETIGWQRLFRRDKRAEQIGLLHRAFSSGVGHNEYAQIQAAYMMALQVQVEIAREQIQRRHSRFLGPSDLAALTNELCQSLAKEEALQNVQTRLLALAEIYKDNSTAQAISEAIGDDKQLQNAMDEFADASGENIEDTANELKSLLKGKIESTVIPEEAKGILRCMLSEIESVENPTVQPSPDYDHTSSTAAEAPSN